MIYAFICLILGVAVWFVPQPYRSAVMVAALVCAALYLRHMAQRARQDAR